MLWQGNTSFITTHTHKADQLCGDVYYKTRGKCDRWQNFDMLSQPFSQYLFWFDPQESHSQVGLANMSRSPFFQNGSSEASARSLAKYLSSLSRLPPSLRILLHKYWTTWDLTLRYKVTQGPTKSLTPIYPPFKLHAVSESPSKMRMWGENIFAYPF